MIVIFPFIVIVISLLISHYSHKIGKDIILFSIYFFICALILLLISLALTILNNWQTKRQAHDHITYNYNGACRKMNIINGYFKHKFGNNLKYQKYYSITSENNIPLDQFMKIYVQKGVDKRDGK